MANILIKPPWQGREREITPEDVYLDRRRFLRLMGVGSAGIAGLMAGCGDTGVNAQQADNEVLPPSLKPTEDPLQSPMPAFEQAVTRNPAFKVEERGLTPYAVAAKYNNFYEFTTEKEGVARLAARLTTKPWSIEVTGLVSEPRTVDFEEILKQFPLEERIYRFRCVEAWAMTVPWVGIPLAKVIEWLGPDPKATHVRFVTLNRPAEMPGIESQPWYPWPFYEGLRMDEAMNEMTFLTVGMYGKVIPNQNGAPVRIITPWKYGYKSPKSIVKIEFTDSQPKTFWNDLQPKEYSFLSNVEPDVPHPRWSQATERLIPHDDRVKTKLYNGYGEWVAKLYA